MFLFYPDIQKKTTNLSTSSDGPSVYLFFNEPVQVGSILTKVTFIFNCLLPAKQTTSGS